jgi:hypothetical protein
MLSDACVSLLPRFVVYLYSFVDDLKILNNYVVNSNGTILMKVIE